LAFSAIEEVLPALPIEPLPQCPAELRGVVFVRGQLIPVIDAAQRLGVTRVRPPEPPIVSVRLGQRVVGIEVDEVLDLLDLTAHPALSADMLVSPGPAGDSAAAGWTATGRAGASPMVAAVDVEGKTIRLLDAQRLGAPGVLRESALREDFSLENRQR
jgi:chemotaxis signal transduction protein